MKCKSEKYLDDTIDISNKEGSFKKKNRKNVQVNFAVDEIALHTSDIVNG